MKKWMLIALAVEIVLFAVLSAVYVHHRHYKSDRYSYVVLAKEHESYQIALKWDSLRDYVAFMFLGELSGKTAVEYSAGFCQLITPCLNDKDRQVMDAHINEQFTLIKTITEQFDRE